MPVALPDYLLPHLTKLRAIEQQLRGAGRILIIPHRRPDGDAIGAVTALWFIIRHWGGTADIFCLDPVPDYLKFVPASHLLTIKPEQLLSYSTVIVLDADLTFSGIADLVKQISPVQLFNIDHHATNTGQGMDIAIVAPQASSTCEIIFYAAKLWAVTLTPNLATSLLCGIVTDTGILSNPAASPWAFTAASQLVSYGARWHEVVTYTNRTRALAVWRLWGTALQRLRYHQLFNLAVTFIRQADIAAAGVEAIEGIANFLGAFCRVPTIMVLREQTDGTIKGSLRTTAENVDVAELAISLGGGGHKKASGFVMPGKLEEQNGVWRVVSDAPASLPLQKLLSAWLFLLGDYIQAIRKLKTVILNFKHSTNLSSRAESRLE